MGTKKKSWPRRNAPSFRGGMLVYESRGQLVASKWPRPRGRPRNPNQIHWHDWLRETNIAWRYLPARMRDEAFKAAKNRQQLARDLFTAATRGTLWSVSFDDGTVLYPTQARDLVSTSLDLITAIKGGLLVRGGDIWEGIPPGLADGQRLSWNASTGLPEWRPPTPPPVGVVYTPPSTTDFPTWVNQQGSNLENASTGPLVLARPTLSGVNLTGRAQALPPGGGTYRLGLRGIMYAIQYSSFGLFVRDSMSERLVTFGWSPNYPYDHPRPILQRWTNPTTFSLHLYDRPVLWSGATFLQLRFDGTTFYFDLSADDALYQTWFTEAASAWVQNPDEWGYFVANRTAEGNPTNLAVFHYAKT